MRRTAVLMKRRAQAVSPDRKVNRSSRWEGGDGKEDKRLMKKFWNWKSRKIRDQASGEEVTERVLFLNGTIAEESWFDDDVTPSLFR